MIKSLTAFGAAGLLAAGATVALAATNQYTTTARITPAAKGTKAKPVPVALTTTFQVSEAGGQRPATIGHFEFFFAGVRSNGRYFPTCTAARINAAGSDASCAKGSQVGSGKTRAISGVTTNPDDQSFHCALQTKAYNAPNHHLALYLRSDPATCNNITVNRAIDAKYIKAGTPQERLSYDVPKELNHSVAAISSATVFATTTFPRRTTTVKGKKVGYLEAVGGCVGGKRAVKLTFGAEDGTKGAATTKSPC